MRPVLMFHDIVDAPSTSDAFAVSKGRFRDILTQVASYNESAGPARAAILTFDDGCASHHSVAFPMLLEAGLGATFFISPRFAPKGHIGERAIREMSNLGMRICSHTLTHPNLGTVSRSFVLRELMESKRIIEDITGVECTELALPGGMLSHGLLYMATGCGYSRVYGSVPAMWDGESFMVPRFCIRESISSDQARLLMEGRLSKYLVTERMKSGLRALLGPRLYPMMRRYATRGGHHEE